MPESSTLSAVRQLLRGFYFLASIVHFHLLYHLDPVQDRRKTNTSQDGNTNSQLVAAGIQHLSSGLRSWDREELVTQ